MVKRDSAYQCANCSHECMRTHVPSNVSADWSCPNATDDQGDDVLHKIPPKRILHMVYNRRTIGADEALAIGLLSEVVPRATLNDAVEKMLAHLLDRNRAALCGVKEYIGAALYTDPHGAARLASNLLACVLSSPKEN